MAFSLVAVIILLISSMTIALVSDYSSENDTATPSFETMHKLFSSVSEAADELQQSLYLIALDIIGKSSIMDESEINREFREASKEYVDNAFPKHAEIYAIFVEEFDVYLAFLKASMGEVYQELLAINEDDEAESHEISVPAYFCICGNFTLFATSSHGNLTKTFEISKPIYIPIPFLANRIATLSESISNDGGEFEKIVKYQLTALVQDRILKGYGVDAKLGEYGTASILTEEDVKNAIRLALLIEDRKYLRNLDNRLIASLISDSASYDSWRLISDKNFSGMVDPAELFLQLFSAGEYSYSMLVSQVLFATADAVVLRWLEYLHIIDLVNTIEQAADLSEVALSNFIESILGNSAIEESIINWMMTTLERAGYSASNYRYFNYGGPDASVYIPAHKVVLTNSRGENIIFCIQGNYPLDFPSVDIFSSELWKKFAIEYKLETHYLADSLIDFVKSIALAIRDSKNLPQVEINRNPADNISYASSLKESFLRALQSSNSSLESVIEATARLKSIFNSMGEALVDFFEQYQQELFKKNESIHAAIESLATLIVDDLILSSYSFDDEAERKATIEILCEIEQSTEWGLKNEIAEMFDIKVSHLIEILKEAFLGAIDDYSYGPLRSEILSLALGIVGELPGINSMLTKTVTRLLGDIENAFELRGDEIFVASPELKSFRLLTDTGRVLLESIEIINAGNEFDKMADDNSDDERVFIQITRPWEFQEKSHYYPNRHITNITNLTFLPYITQWDVSVRGSYLISISASAPESRLLGQFPLTMSREIEFDLDFSISAQSAWPLHGVHYQSTSTFGRDVANFLEKIWNEICGGIAPFISIVDSLQSTMGVLLSAATTYSIRFVESLSATLQFAIENIRNLFVAGMDSVLGWICDNLISLLGKIQFNLTIWGLKFQVVTNPLEIALGFTKDILRITCWLSHRTTNISVAIRFLRMANGDYDIIANATIQSKRWFLDVLVDPLMRIFNHFVQVTGKVGNSTLELHMPLALQYKKLRFALSSIPVIGQFLSRIPLPIPGLIGSLDAGFEIKYRSPIANHLVINEYEQNPPGTDFGREWIELYNPTDRFVSLSGWSIQTMHGIQEIATIEEDCIEPHGYRILVLQGQVLDNGGEWKFPLSECIALIDPSGRKVDMAPLTTDFYNDDRTWQRAYDGNDRWIFKSETRGKANGRNALTPSSDDWVYKVFSDAALRAFSELSVSSADLDGLGNLIEEIIRRVLRKCIEAVGDFILEFKLDVVVTISDATCITGTGFAVSLVFKGDTVAKALESTLSVISSSIRRITTPDAEVFARNEIVSFLQDIYLRFEIFAFTGFSKLFLSCNQELKFRVAVMMETNVYTLLGIIQREPVNATITMGLMICEVPSRFISPLFGVGNEGNTDLWAFRLRIFPENG